MIFLPDIPKGSIAMDFTNREFFLRFSRQPDAIGLNPVRHSVYELTRPDGSSIEIRSMLSTHEIALLYACAKDAWVSGAIVDLGPLSGASTWALAKGLTDRKEGTPEEPGIIHSYDLWRGEDSYRNYLTDYRCSRSSSLLGHWIEVLDGYHNLCEPHQGDFCTWQWDGSEIGILFIDVAKSWKLNNHVVSTMFPALQPGSILIQQDYIQWNEYWIHMEMARFSDYFEHCQFLRGATSFYRCIKTPPSNICESSLTKLSYQERVELHELERSKAPASINEVMKIAAAKHAMDNHDFLAARKYLDDVDVSVKTDNPLIEVSGIVKSNLSAAFALLEKLTD